MLDAAFIREHLDAVKANCANRNVKADVDRVVQLDDERRRFAGETQSVQQRQNEVSKLIPKEKDAARKQELIAEGKALREQAGVLEKQQKQAKEELHAALLTIPNMTHPDAPVGKEPTDNKVIRTLGRAAQVRLPAERSRRPGRSAGPRGLRGRRVGGRAEVLLPQERGRAARTGPRPICDADAR